MTGGTFLACLHLFQRPRRPGAIGLTRLCDIPVSASDIPVSASDIPVSASDIPASASDIPVVLVNARAWAQVRGRSN